MLNEVHLIGHVGQNPEKRYTQGGTAVLKFSLATTERWTDPNSHERRERTQWHRITVWGKAAERQADVLRSGSKIFVKGKLQYSTYEKEGTRMYATDIIANNIIWLDPKNRNEPNSQQNQPQQSESSNTNQPLPPDPEELYSENNDDDIPF